MRTLPVNAWTPWRIAARQKTYWWDASEPRTIARDVNNVVTAWTDKANGVIANRYGNTSHQAYYRPLGTQGVSARSPAILFDGWPSISDGFFCTAANDVSLPASGITVCAVAARQDSLTSGAYPRVTSFIGTGGAGLNSDTRDSTSIIPIMGDNGTSQYAMYANGGTLFAIAAPRFPVSQSNVISFRLDAVATTALLRLCGEASVSASYPYTLSTTGRIQIGGPIEYNNQIWTGPISEVIWFNRVLSTAELQRVEGYLAAKWRVRLAPSHPFAGRVPMAGPSLSVIGQPTTRTLRPVADLANSGWVAV